MKKAIIFLILMTLVSCGFPGARDREETQNVTAEVYDEEDYVNISELEGEYSDHPEIDGCRLLGGKIGEFYGYDMSVPTGDGGNLRCWKYGVKTELGALNEQEGINGSICDFAGSVDGKMYFAIHPEDKKGTVRLAAASDGYVSIVGDMQIEDGGVFSASIRFGEEQIGVLTKSIKENEENRSCEAAIYIKNENGLTEIAREVAEEDFKNGSSSGAELMDFCFKDGEICALGRGLEDGIFVYNLYRYSLSGLLEGYERLFETDFGGELRIFPRGEGFLVVGSDFVWGEDIPSGGLSSAFDGDYAVIWRKPGSGKAEAWIFPTDGSEAGHVRCSLPEGCELMRVVAVEGGFVAEYEEDGVTRHVGVRG